MQMYNLLEYSNNYSMTSGGLWNYHRNKVNDDVNGNNSANNCMINKNKPTKHRSFEYKTKRIASTLNDNDILDK